MGPPGGGGPTCPPATEFGRSCCDEVKEPVAVPTLSGSLRSVFMTSDGSPSVSMTSAGWTEAYVADAPDDVEDDEEEDEPRLERMPVQASRPGLTALS